MNLYRLGACLKCRGDLAYDDGDWKCLQCGVYYYTNLYPRRGTAVPGLPLFGAPGIHPAHWDGDDDLLASAAD